LGLFSIGLIALKFGLVTDGLGKLLLGDYCLVAALIYTSVVELLGCEDLPLGDVLQPEFFLLLDVGEVLGKFFSMISNYLNNSSRDLI
jgi:hypothetical protein